MRDECEVMKWPVVQRLAGCKRPPGGSDSGLDGVATFHQVTSDPNSRMSALKLINAK